MSRRAKLLLVIMLAVLAAGSYYLRVLAKRVFYQTPPQAESTIRARLSEAALRSASGGDQIITLYFPSYGQGKLASESRTVALAATDNDRIRQILLALIQGSRQGNSPALPPSVTLRAVFLAPDGTAYLDLAGDFSSGTSTGIATESLAVYSIVGSLAANIPAVKRVKILLQGQEVDTLSGHADLSGYFAADVERLMTPAP